MSETGRIIKSIAGFYEVYSAGTVYRCRARGVFRALNQKPLVGDDVEIEITDTVSVPMEGRVVRLLPRRSSLIRPNVANVDQALLLFAVTQPEPSYNMLDRFLISMECSGIPSILCFNKLDLAAQGQVPALREIYENCGCRVMFISAADGDSAEEVRGVLQGRTTVITGPSGVGKSTLINRLCPGANMETDTLSRRIERGKNTTRHVELLPAGFDDTYSTFLVDTPGFTSLYLMDVTAEQLKHYYPEFAPYSGNCRYQGCNHLAEPGCAVKRAVREGAVSRIRYENYTEIYAGLRDRRPVY